MAQSDKHTCSDPHCGETHPHISGGPLEEARAHLENGSYQELIAFVRRADHASLPDSDQGELAAMELAALEELGEDAARRELLERHSRSDRPEFLLTLGTALCDLGAAEDGIAVLERLCSVDAVSPVGPLNLAIALRHIGEYERALVAVEDALERDPEFAPSYREKSELLDELARPSESASAMREYIRRRSADPDDWLRLAEVENLAGNAAASDAAFEEAERRGAPRDHLYYGWAIAATIRGDLQRLVRCERRLAAAAPADFRVAVVRGCRAEAEGDLQAALIAYREGFRIACDDPRSGAAEHAAMALLRLLRDNPRRDVARESVAKIFERNLFSPDICELVRQINGRTGKNVRQYFVSIEGALTDADLTQQLRDSGIKGELRYTRTYQILADSRREADRIALEIERTYGGGADLSIVDGSESSAHGEDLIGVSWRSEIQPFVRDQPPTGKPHDANAN